jgi:hypothetical protein
MAGNNIFKAPESLGAAGARRLDIARRDCPGEPTGLESKREAPLVLDFHKSARPTVYHTSGPARRKVFYCVAAAGLIYLIGFRFVPFVMSPLHAPAEAPIDTLLAQRTAGEKLPGQFVATAPTAAETRPESPRRFAGVRDDLLRDVRDDDLFRSREHDAFFHLLELAGKTPDEALRAASLGRIAYAQLHQQAPQYRGQVVTIHGALRQLQRLPAGRNKYGIDHYYQATIQPEDNPVYPIIVYLLELPPGFPSKLAGDATSGPEEHRAEVDVTGFFYRRLAYRAHDDVRVAPLLLARSFQWIVRDAAAQAETTGQLSIIAALLTVTVIVLILVATRSRGRIVGPPSAARNAALPAGALAALRNEVVGPTPQDSLRALAEHLGDESAGNPPRHIGQLDAADGGGRA